jgi:hypothetical protein
MCEKIGDAVLGGGQELSELVRSRLPCSQDEPSAGRDGRRERRCCIARMGIAELKLLPLVRGEFGWPMMAWINIILHRRWINIAVLRQPRNVGPHNVGLLIRPRLP